MPDPFEQGFLEGLRLRAQSVAAGAAEQADAPVPDAVEELRALLAALWRYSVDGIVITHRGSWILVEVSDSFCSMTGFDRVELLGRTPRDLGLMQGSSVRLPTEADDTSSWEGLYETRLHRRDGSILVVEFSRQPLGERFMATIVRDVTRRHDLEVELRHLAETDPLTGLLNRRKFAAEAEREIRQTHRFGDPITLITLDVDGLKAINDEHGHHLGDTALRAVADTIRRNIREIDFAGRLGGDEFAVLLTRSDHSGAGRVLKAIIADLDLIRLDTETAEGLPISASAGLITTHTPTDLDTLMRTADQAMYRTKNQRRNQ